MKLPWQAYVQQLVNRGFPLETIVYCLELKYPNNFFIENGAVGGLKNDQNIQRPRNDLARPDRTKR